ncbi:MAG: SGNH/GDSL hydrolase family protein [Clostridium perfringens]|nr:SGNH/GDSL hydrolase family protein [Clostridium perfringens]
MKIAIMGDSISQGIGSKKINYSKFLSEKYLVKNFALTGTTIEYGKRIINNVIEYKPDIVILFYGNVDALPRVKTDTYIYKKILPNRYKKLGMLDPRALYSSDIKKKIIQVIDSNFRYRFKNFLVKYQGYEQWVSIDKFEENYKFVLSELKKKNINVICTSNILISEKYFKYANKEYLKYNQIIKKLSNNFDAIFIDLYNELAKYNSKEIFLNDLYHPNEEGYKLISEIFINKIDKIII